MRKKKNRKKWLPKFILITLLISTVLLVYLLYKDIQDAKGLITNDFSTQDENKNIDTQEETNLSNEENVIEENLQDNPKEQIMENNTNENDNSTHLLNTNLTQESELNLFKTLLNVVRQEIPNRGKSSADVALVYIKREPDLLTKTFNDYPYELQTSSNRVKDELAKLENFNIGVKLVKAEVTIEEVPENIESDVESEKEAEPIATLGDQYNVDGILKVHNSDYPIGTLFSIEDIETNETFYFLLNDDPEEKTLEKLIDEKVRIKTVVSKVEPGSILYSVSAAPIKI